MKKVILGVLALIFATALVVGGYFLIFSRTLQKYAVEEDVLCPYSWQERRDGTYRLKIDTSACPDASWSVECYPKNVVAAAEESSEAGTAEFSLFPLNMGQTYVQVYCEQTDPIAVRVFEIGMQISVSEKHEITVETTEHKSYTGITNLGETGDAPIQWWTDPNGAVNLLITEESSSWEIVDYAPNSMDVDGPFYRQGSCGFEIRGKLAGTFPVMLYDGRAKAICVEVAVSEDLTAAVTSATVDTYVPDRSEEHTALETAVGRELALPAQAVATGYYVSSKNGTVQFLLNDLQWEWQISADKTVEDLVGEAAANALETETDSSGLAVSLSAYRLSDGVVAAWNDGDCAMTVYGEREVALSDVLAVARQILEENDGQ